MKIERNCWKTFNYDTTRTTSNANVGCNKRATELHKPLPESLYNLHIKQAFVRLE